MKQLNRNDRNWRIRKIVLDHIEVWLIVIFFDISTDRSLPNPFHGVNFNFDQEFENDLVQCCANSDNVFVDAE